MRLAWMISVMLSLSTLAAPALASKTVKDYVTQKNENTKFLDKIYLTGIENGLQTYQEMIKARGTNAMDFCVPNNLALTTDQIDDILRRWAKRQPKGIDDMLLGVAEFLALADAFPCSRAK